MKMEGIPTLSIASVVHISCPDTRSAFSSSVISLIIFCISIVTSVIFAMDSISEILHLFPIFNQ